MPSQANLRLTATLATSVTAALAILSSEAIPDDSGLVARTILPMLGGAALAQWLLFPLFAKKPGGMGVLFDVGLYLAVMALAGLMSGTLLIPGVGTVIGPLVALSLPTQSPLTAAICIAGAALVIGLIRRARPLLQPPK